MLPLLPVFPAKAGIQGGKAAVATPLDPRFRGGDGSAFVKTGSEERWGGKGDCEHDICLPARHDGYGCPCRAQGVAFWGSGFSPAVARRRRGFRGALAGDAGGSRVRLSAHRLAVDCRVADDAANAADGAVRRHRRRLGRAARAAHRAYYRCHFDAITLAVPGTACCERYFQLMEILT